MGQAKRRGSYEERVQVAKARPGIMVAFYDQDKHQLIEVERWDGSWGDVRIASTGLAQLYQSGKHNLPSPVWCVWDEEDSSLFFLDEDIKDEDFCSQVEELMLSSSR